MTRQSRNNRIQYLQKQIMSGKLSSEQEQSYESEKRQLIEDAQYETDPNVIW